MSSWYVQSVCSTLRYRGNTDALGHSVENRFVVGFEPDDVRRLARPQLIDGGIEHARCVLPGPEHHRLADKLRAF
jgi:hypothetical protein